MTDPETQLPADVAPFEAQEPRVGLPASAALHVAPALALVVFSFFGQPKPFDAEAESIPVEMITESQLREMTRGVKTAKAVIPNAPERIDRVDPVKRDNDPGEAKTDVPPPLPPKRVEEAARDVKPEPPPEIEPPKPEPKKAEPAKVATLAPTPAPQPTPRPTPPLPPVAPQKTEQDEPDDAEIVKQASKAPPKPEPPRPDPVKVAELKKQDDARKAAEEQRKLDEAKKADDQKKADEKRLAEEKKKLEERKRVALAAKKAEEDRKKKEAELNQPSMDVEAIRRKLLASHDTPAATGSTGQTLSRTASLGTATGTSAKLSPSDRDTIVGILQSQMQRCWNLTVTAAPRVKPIVSLQLSQAGQIIGGPTLKNTSDDPNFRAVAESGMRAIRQCATYSIPSRFMAFYEDWKSLNVELDSANLL